ncbi:hypothetical protein KJ359_001088 [Pestalotiopsis sp. 9143b]|nr:hypothetical protein KJ359_001088 [Pestalotiopsis sp. 9143b]
MPGKHDAVESSSARRPLAQKLTGLIIRRGGGAAKGAQGQRSPDIVDEKAGSIFRFKRQRKALSPDATPEFKPLDLDLNRLSLSEGWLDTPKDEELPQEKGKQQQQPPQPQPQQPAQEDSTPIANRFSTILSLGTEDQGKIDWPYLQKQDSNSNNNNNKRPYSMVETTSLAYKRPLQSSSAQSVGSVLDRGRPVEPKRYVTDPLWKTNAILPDPPVQNPPPVVERTPTARHAARKSINSIHSIQNDSTALSATTKHNIAAAPQAKAPEKLDRVGRHSMYATPTPATTQPALKTAANPPSRSSSTNPLDRIQQWQKSVTSAPTSNPGPPAATPASAPQSTVPSRRTSTRGVGNRLAWIKELEEKKSGSLGQDIGVLKKASGSVSNRLAMFESKQASAAPPLSKKPPLTRTNSNSTTSRLSSVNLDSTFSVNGNTTATPRTSGETVRSSHRASSVMSYYDDSFREKMENVASGYSDKDKEKAEKEKAEKAEKLGLQRVKASFVSVDPKNKRESTTSVGSESSAKEEETKSAEPVAAVEKVESKTEEEKPQASQPASPVVEAPKAEEEVKSEEPAVAENKTEAPVAEVKAEPQVVEAATADVAAEKEEAKTESS